MAVSSRRTKGEYDETIGKRLMISVHPLVRLNPKSGEWVLNVSPGFLKSMVSLT
jgi:taurine dioxygenase